MRTSANVDSVFYDAMVSLSEISFLPVSEIFKDLVITFLRSSNQVYITGRLTEYQRHSPELWIKLDYYLSPEENELFSRIRQCYKISISNLAFAAFLLCWHLVVRKYCKKIKNKCMRSYDKYKEKLVNLCCYYIKRFYLTGKEKRNSWKT